MQKAFACFFYGVKGVMAGLSRRVRLALRPVLLQVQDSRAKWGMPFTFGLLPFILLVALSFSSCSMNPNLQGKGEPYLQGEWQQDSSALQQKLVTASSYHMKFDCDSFFVTINSRTNVKYGVADSCTKNGRYAEYLKGTYRQKNDTLFLKGQFCNANFTLKLTPDCFRSGMYEEFFKVSQKADTAIQLSGTSSVIPIQLHLIKRTNCIQKPL